MPAVVVSGGGDGEEFKGRTTTMYVILCVFIAAFGGLMFGYDIGISGGVTSMDDFLKEFFPAVYARKQKAQENNYCKFDNQFLQLFTSSLYLAALVASFVASKICTLYGRRPTIQIASAFFIIGVVLTAAAANLGIAIIGRVLLGFGVGFANQAVPLFLSEIAPTRIRGALNISFQLFVTIGILLANFVNFWVANIHPYGWRIALGGAGIPAIILCFGSLIICETPTSLIERNHLEKGHKTLRKIRGVADVDAEYSAIVEACDAARQVKHPFRKLIKKKSRPPVIIAILLQVFQQCTGINAIMFYAPVLFQTMGFKNHGALLSAVVTGLVNVFSTIVSVVVVDKLGRRILLLEACVQMFISLLGVGIILNKDLSVTGTLGKTEAVVVVLLVCLFVMSFAWSWGPLGWLIPSETFPLETRSAGFSLAVSSNMLFTFIIAQAFLSMLCAFKAWIFFFFAFCIFIMGLFTAFFIPETKGVPIESITEVVWKQHWYWKGYMDEDHIAPHKSNV